MTRSMSNHDPASTREFTIRALLLGVGLAIILGAANTYLGLYAGLTVSASIPAAVISMAILRGVFRSGTLKENNIVQSVASAGESLAAGVIFTVPAILLVGAWQDFAFWPTTLIAATGGILGVIFMVPLRRALIVERKDLTYPEGVACAEVLQAGEGGSGGMRLIALGALVGADLARRCVPVCVHGLGRSRRGLWPPGVLRRTRRLRRAGRRRLHCGL